MSKTVDEKYFYDDEEEALKEEEEDRKCPPQLVPSSLNPNEDWAAFAQKDEAVAVKEAVLFDEEEEMIKRGAFGHALESEPNKLSTSNDGRNTARRAFGGQADYSLGAEEPNMQEWHCPNVTEEGQIQTQELVSPGAFREGGPDIEEGYGEDEFTVASEEENEDQAPVETCEKLIDPVSAELVNVAEEESRRAFCGQPHYSLGVETVDTQGQPCPHATEERRHHIQNSILPGAYREGGPDIEEGYEDDGFTITTEEESEENEDQAPVETRQKSIDPVSAELVNVAEEQRRLQEQIDQALERERQRAVVAEVVPVNDGDLPQSDAHKFGTRKRRWFVIGTILLIVVAITTALALTLPKKHSDCERHGYFGPHCDLYYPSCSAPETARIGDGSCDGKPYNTEECGWDDGDCCAPDDSRPICKVTGYPNCSVPIPGWIGDGECDGEPYNVEECGWDGGDCCAPGYFGINCTLYYPNCSVPIPGWIGNGVCDGEPYNTEGCEWDGNDCCPPGYFGPNCTLNYPNCQASIPQKIGDGRCDSKPYNTMECGWDGGDCCDPGYFGLNCDQYHPNCTVSLPGLIGNGVCENQYNTMECGWEGGDCIPCDDGYFGMNCDLYYPNCSVPYPESELIGDGWCDGLPYNIEECGWDGGDCCAPGYFGPNCDLYYPNCSVSLPEYIGDGICDIGAEICTENDCYVIMGNTEECGWEGGDCVNCDDGYFGPDCNITGYPNCSVDYPALIGDGICDGNAYDTEECGWDGGDCVHCNASYFGPNCTLYYPNCSVSSPELIGDGYCDDVYNTTECGWEGGDCLPCNTSYFGPNCDLYYPNCSVPFPESESIGDGWCEGFYNTTECGWEGGDCLPCDDGYFGFDCDLYYPNCSVPIPEWIGDGACDGEPYNVEECGWDGGDCL